MKLRRIRLKAGWDEARRSPDRDAYQAWASEQFGSQAFLWLVDGAVWLSPKRMEDSGP